MHATPRTQQFPVKFVLKRLRKEVKSPSCLCETRSYRGCHYGSISEIPTADQPFGHSEQADRSNHFVCSFGKEYYQWGNAAELHKSFKPANDNGGIELALDFMFLPRFTHILP
jgi:hypothetical protein